MWVFVSQGTCQDRIQTTLMSIDGPCREWTVSVSLPRSGPSHDSRPHPSDEHYTPSVPTTLCPLRTQSDNHPHVRTPTTTVTTPGAYLSGKPQITSLYLLEPGKPVRLRLLVPHTTADLTGSGGVYPRTGPYPRPSPYSTSVQTGPSGFQRVERPTTRPSRDRRLWDSFVLEVIWDSSPETARPTDWVVTF